MNHCDAKLATKMYNLILKLCMKYAFNRMHKIGCILCAYQTCKPFNNEKKHTGKMIILTKNNDNDKQIKPC